MNIASIDNTPVSTEDARGSDLEHNTTGTTRVTRDDLKYFWQTFKREKGRHAFNYVGLLGVTGVAGYVTYKAYSSTGASLETGFCATVTTMLACGAAYQRDQYCKNKVCADVTNALLKRTDPANAAFLQQCNVDGTFEMINKRCDQMTQSRSSGRGLI